MKRLFLSAFILVAMSGPALAQSDAQFVNMVTTLTDQDFETFMDGGDSLIGSGITDPMSASQLITMYEKNELAANKKLKGKLVRIKSKASAIGEDAFGNAFIKVDGSNQFKNILLYVDGKDDRILSLEKGSKVDFVCKMDKYIMQTPMLNGCAMTSDVAQQRRDEVIKAAVSDELTSKRQALFISIYSENKDALSKPCEKAGKPCLDAVIKIIKSKDLIAKAKESATKLIGGKNVPDDIY